MVAAERGRDKFSAMHAQSVRPEQLLVKSLHARAGSGQLNGPWLDEARPFESRMLLDALSYMPDDILVKVDRAAMAFSLETRAPLLDHRVFEFAWRVPYDMKVRNGIGKQPLRELLHRYVPRGLIDRPKRGFAVPLAAWLRGPLRPWAEELIGPYALHQQRLFDPEPIARLWHQHVHLIANHSGQLWTILTLMAFIRRETE